MTTPMPGVPEPRLTVIMTAWNAAATIERAIASVLAEHDVSLECIVVDDGSTDDTVAVVRSIAERDPRVVLEPLPSNGGVSAARNRGLALARGEWLAFLDADDRLLSGGVAALMRPTSEAGVRVVVGQRIWTDGERTWLSKVYDIPDITTPGRKSIATHPGLLYYASSTGKAIHRSLIEGLAFEGRVLGDQPWTIAAMLRAGDGIEVIADVVYEWTRPHPDRYVETIGAATRASSSRAAEMAAFVPRVYRQVADEIDRTVLEPRLREDLKLAYFDRLIRADLGPPVVLALERRDADAGRLLDAIAAFLEIMPPRILARSGPLVRNVLRPPAVQWRRLVPAARAGYWAMVRGSVRADRRVMREVLGLAGLPAFAAAETLGAPVGTAIASSIFMVLGATRRAARRMLGRRDVAPVRSTQEMLVAGPASSASAPAPSPSEVD